MNRRRPIALTDAELYSLLWVSNIAIDDFEMWNDMAKREEKAHARANQKLRAEVTRRLGGRA